MTPKPVKADATTASGLRSSVVSGLDVPEPLRESLLLAGAHRALGYAIAIISAEPPGLVMTWNRGAQRLLGYREADIVGRHFSQLYPIHDIDDGLPRIHLDNALTMGNCNVEQWMTTKDGAGVWVDLDLTCLRNSADELRGFVLMAKDLTRHRTTQDELTRLALHDPLTGLPNRRLLVDRATQAIERQERQGTTVVLMVLDLDDFKMVNDTFGHHAGDEILTELAGRLQDTLRPGDTVGRFGGDEFVVVCEDLPDANQAVRIARRLLDAVRAPVSVESGRVRITATVGVVLSPSSHDDFESLIQHADAAMYRAKATGGNDLEVIRLSHPD
ncbi:MAG: diguanylate cyclase domain-containing protein [Actinomycetota bacterium]